MANQLVVRDQITQALAGSLHRGEHGLKVLPGLLRKALEERAWEERIVEVTGERFSGFPSFDAYISATPPEGLGANVGLLRDLLSRDPLGPDLLDKALQRPPGRPPKTLDNIQGFPDGTSKAAALRRLRKQRPDLHERVLAGELSPHRAAVLAGFRPATITVRLDDPRRAMTALLKHFPADQLREALTEA